MMRFLFAIFATAAVVGFAAADSVTLRGSTIPLPNCNIQDIKSGRVYYSDSRGRRQWRELEEVAALGFDELPELDEAEKLLASGASSGGMRRLLQALIKAEDELPQLWVRVRLVRAHDARGEYVQAVGHAAAVFLLREESYWRLLTPISKPDRPGYPAVKEALDNLRKAKRSVSNRDLIAVIDRFMEVVQPIHDELEATYDGPPVDVGSTRSGVPLGQIRTGQFVLGAQHVPPSPSPELTEQPKKPAGATVEPTVEPVPEPLTTPQPPAGDSAEAIDALLAAGRSTEALAACQRLAKSPGNRSLSRFLHQYGRCLVAEDRPRDAAVMFMRCAVLYQTSPQATMSLIETAAIYLDVFDNPDSARRLLQRAADSAAAQERDDLAAKAQEALAALEGKEAK